MDFDYFYRRDSERYSFYMLPKVLVTDDRFKNLSSDAKVLYSCLLDRNTLSNKSRDKLFSPEYKSLERVIEEFSNNDAFKRFDIFETSIKDILKDKAQILKEQVLVEEDNSEEIVEE